MGGTGRNRRSESTARGIYFSCSSPSVTRFARFLRWIAPVHIGFITAAGPSPLLGAARPAHSRSDHRRNLLRARLLPARVVPDYASRSAARRHPPIGGGRSQGSGWGPPTPARRRGGR